MAKQKLMVRQRRLRMGGHDLVEMCGGFGGRPGRRGGEVMAVMSAGCSWSGFFRGWQGDVIRKGFDGDGGPFDGNDPDGGALWDQVAVADDIMTPAFNHDGAGRPEHGKGNAVFAEEDFFAVQINNPHTLRFFFVRTAIQPILQELEPIRWKFRKKVYRTECPNSQTFIKPIYYFYFVKLYRCNFFAFQVS